MYLNRRQKVKQEGERRSVFLRYLGEVANACAAIDNKLDRDALYERLLHVAKRKTAEADTKLDDRGKKVQAADEEDFGENVLIVEPAETTEAE